MIAKLIISHKSNREKSYKLEENGVEKLIPEDEIISKAYIRAMFLQKAEKEYEKILETFKDEKIEVPENLKEQIEKIFEEDCSISWDLAIWKIAGDAET